jgi:hypothetical protein
MVVALTAVLVLGSRAVSADGSAPLPKMLDAAPCQNPPTVDGVIDAREWRDAPVVEFAISMIRLDPARTEVRPCELRVMNSATALYVALKIPDKTVDNQLAPLALDCAMLAFCQGSQVQARDDRKVIAEGLYRDKFVEAPGKGDGDDAHQDGRGAMTRENGIVSLEWAIPLDSGDRDDIRAKPGDSLRFNLCYFDALQLPLTKTNMGGGHGIHLDKVDEWGTLRLASNVRDDGGKAFQSPAWVQAVAAQIGKTSAMGLRATGDAWVPGSPPAAKVLVSFTYRDPAGREKEAKAKVFVPESAKAGSTARRPLFFAAGYELPDGAEHEYLRRGWVVVSPRELETNPLIRTTNPDVALLHLARALPWVDDARVVIGGGSAGGWMTLMLASETFPLSGAAPDVPPLNWGYNAAYFFKQLEKTGPATAAKVPAHFVVGTMLKPCVPLYGASFDDRSWFADSPLAVIPTITCPVSVYFSTADVLVPIDQLGEKWVQPLDRLFPEGFTMDPQKLVNSRQARTRLVDVLPETDREIFAIAVPSGTPRHNFMSASGRSVSVELPVSADKPWSIAVIDEGPPIPTIDHRKYDLNPTRNGFWDRVLAQGIAPAQLTLTKLERLMDRYAGKEWLGSNLLHLDFADRERADVVRGLRTYVRASTANAHRFTELYARLASARQVLDAALLRSLEVGAPAP